MSHGAPKTFADYAERFPKDVQKRLRDMRETIQKAAPSAIESISYGMPALSIGGIVIWFGAFTTHIGFYPGALAIATFVDELSTYKTAKGSVQFPFDEPLPRALVTRMVKYRMQRPRS